MIQLPLSANPTLPLQATKTRLRYHLQSWALRSSALPNEEERRASCQWTSAAPRTMASWKSALDKQDLPHLWFGTQTCLWRLQEWSRPGMTERGQFCSPWHVATQQPLGTGAPSVNVPKGSEGPLLSFVAWRRTMVAHGHIWLQISAWGLVFQAVPGIFRKTGLKPKPKPAQWPPVWSPIAE